MKIQEIETILDEVLNRSHRWIKNGKEIANERVFHHMFSSLVTIDYNKKNVDPWELPLLYPEHQTNKKFTWNKVDINNVAYTRKHAVEQGTGGNFDMVILDKETTIIEWKGPKVFTKTDMAKTMLKLFLQPKNHIKIIAAITVTTASGRTKHIATNEKRFHEEFDFASEVLQLKNVGNFYVYIATIDREMCSKLHWGKFS